MDQKQGATRITHEHSLTCFHILAGIHTDPIAHPDIFHLDDLGLHEGEALCLPFEKIEGLFKLHLVAGIDHHLLHPFLKDPKGQLRLLKISHQGSHIGAFGDEILQGDDGPVRAFKDHQLLGGQTTDRLLVRPACNGKDLHIRSGNEIAVGADGGDASQLLDFIRSAIGHHDTVGP